MVSIVLGLGNSLMNGGGAQSAIGRVFAPARFNYDDQNRPESKPRGGQMLLAQNAAARHKSRSLACKL